MVSNARPAMSGIGLTIASIFATAVRSTFITPRLLLAISR